MRKPRDELRIEEMKRGVPSRAHRPARSGARIRRKLNSCDDSGACEAKDWSQLTDAEDAVKVKSRNARRTEPEGTVARGSRTGVPTATGVAKRAQRAAEAQRASDAELMGRLDRLTPPPSEEELRAKLDALTLFRAGAHVHAETDAGPSPRVGSHGQILGVEHVPSKDEGKPFRLPTHEVGRTHISKEAQQS